MFSVCFVITALLPVAFISPRGGYAFYLPALGCVLFLGSAAAYALRLLFEKFEKGLSNRKFMALRSVPFLILVAALTPIHWAGAKKHPPSFYSEYSRQIISDLQRMHPKFPNGTTLYFEDDPYPQDHYTLLFLTQLAYDNPTIRVNRFKIVRNIPPVPLAFRFTFREGRVEPLSPMTSSEIATSKNENVVQILFQPETGRPGEEISIHVEGFAGNTIDVYWKHLIAGDSSYSTGTSFEMVFGRRKRTLHRRVA